MDRITVAAIAAGAVVLLLVVFMFLASARVKKARGALEPFKERLFDPLTRRARLTQEMVEVAAEFDTGQRPLKFKAPRKIRDFDRVVSVDGRVERLLKRLKSMASKNPDLRDLPIFKRLKEEVEAVTRDYRVEQGHYNWAAEDVLRARRGIVASLMGFAKPHVFSGVEPLRPAWLDGEADDVDDIDDAYDADEEAADGAVADAGSDRMAPVDDEDEDEADRTISVGSPAAAWMTSTSADEEDSAVEAPGAFWQNSESSASGVSAEDGEDSDQTIAMPMGGPASWMTAPSAGVDDDASDETVAMSSADSFWKGQPQTGETEDEEDETEGTLEVDVASLIGRDAAGAADDDFEDTEQLPPGMNLARSMPRPEPAPELDPEDPDRIVDDEPNTQPSWFRGHGAPLPPAPAAEETPADGPARFGEDTSEEAPVEGPIDEDSQESHIEGAYVGTRSSSFAQRIVSQISDAAPEASATAGPAATADEPPATVGGFGSQLVNRLKNQDVAPVAADGPPAALEPDSPSESLASAEMPPTLETGPVPGPVAAEADEATAAAEGETSPMPAKELAEVPVEAPVEIAEEPGGQKAVETAAVSAEPVLGDGEIELTEEELAEAARIAAMGEKAYVDAAEVDQNEVAADRGMKVWNEAYLPLQAQGASDTEEPEVVVDYEKPLSEEERLKQFMEKRAGSIGSKKNPAQSRGQKLLEEARARKARQDAVARGEVVEDQSASSAADEQRAQRSAALESALAHLKGRGGGGEGGSDRSGALASAMAHLNMDRSPKKKKLRGSGDDEVTDPGQNAALGATGDS